jgi:hypothetical protein
MPSPGVSGSTVTAADAIGHDAARGRCRGAGVTFDNNVLNAARGRRAGGADALVERHPLGHADFWNTWDQRKLRQEVAECIRRDLVCHVSS